MANVKRSFSRFYLHLVVSPSQLLFSLIDDSTVGEVSRRLHFDTLSEILVGKKQGRTDKDVITIFDSTGVAIEDMATIKFVYEKAKQVGSCTSIDLV